MKTFKNGDLVKFTIANIEERGIIESIDYRDDKSIVATIRYITKIEGKETTINRKLTNLSHAVITATCAGKRALGELERHLRNRFL
ncbi:uncharacterized protein UMAG_11714 [Mycosarcoma maydis]|uniref:Uncharacterized protein n=1 Tax=Mycosarcoma maydis TaxID=5270 RepID=A0A0D1DYR9_MYCMD|nr:uncharacterized protein UMAG_11714 [Ustilago maydis 521]KIS69204.1 hypothetical protein UMAG_11714 [Ustilago maydis 521]|eukprot:XP_011389225.1 hypothetical protein UMAG_11714 [Ustilago maydis 521]